MMRLSYVTKILALMMLAVTAAMAATTCNSKLGLEDKTIPDKDITASSSFNALHLPYRARLNSKVPGGSFAWCAANPLNNQQWIQVDLNKLMRVSGVLMQGRADTYADHRIESYNVMVSRNGSKWSYVKKNKKTPIVFHGNSDRNTVVASMFPRAIKARYVRIRPLTWHNFICLRFELLGCPL